MAYLAICHGNDFLLFYPLPTCFDSCTDRWVEVVFHMDFFLLAYKTYDEKMKASQRSDGFGSHFLLYYFLMNGVGPVNDVAREWLIIYVTNAARMHCNRKSPKKDFS